jgi:ADP-heptose:LPS heptosyltransferase
MGMNKLRHQIVLELLRLFCPAAKNAAEFETPRSILVIRRNRIGDMVCTLPLLHALRKQYPDASIAVACDEPGAPIARASGAADRVIVLKKGWFRLHGYWLNSRQLQGFDVALGVKGGFDRRLATLVRLTNAPVRIGYENAGANGVSLYYTAPLPPPRADEHQVDSCLKLLQPLGIQPQDNEFSLRLPQSAIEYGDKVFSQSVTGRQLAVINISSTQPLLMADTVFSELARKLGTEAGWSVAVASAPRDRARAKKLVASSRQQNIFMLETENILELAAVLKKAGFVFTPEGGVGHLSAALGTPALVFWSGGPFVKWHTRSQNHRHVHVDSFSSPIGLGDLWPIIEKDFLRKPVSHPAA